MVAGGLEGAIFSGVNAKYYDAYGSNSSAKVGDALGNKSTANPGCAGWHGSSTGEWVTSSSPYFNRGSYGLFWFYKEGTVYSDCSRGVAVVGTGL